MHVANNLLPPLFSISNNLHPYYSQWTGQNASYLLYTVNMHVSSTCRPTCKLLHILFHMTAREEV